jgi:lipopolysaccharide biosynthesis glycosyltransferase
VCLPRTTEVFYLTDAPFVVPTLVSIESLRRWKSASELNVNVVLLDMDEGRVDDFKRLAEDLRLQVHSLSTDALASFGNDKFNATHVPYATLARFLISNFFCDQDADILYLDGDTLFIEDPKELLEFPAPEVGLLAAEDQSYFYVSDIGETGENVRSYFCNIGVTAKQGYFNAGVMKFRAREWIKISNDCLLFLENNLAICQYHDQSALNAVAGGKRIRLSPIWNFAPFYWNWGLSEAVRPKLLHFVGGGKPWMGKLEVWSRIYPDFIKAVERRRHASFLLKTWDARQQADRLKAERWQQIKNKTIFLYRMAHRRAQFRNLIDTSVL